MLPINFHKTFIPERRFIAALLQFAAQNKEGDYQEISLETGIPMGESSGKVPAILDYARGMGLIELVEGTKKSAIKKPILTPFGKIVYSEDKFLGEEIIQWLAHMNLCRNDIGAIIWHTTFAKGRKILGANFNKQQLEDFLINTCGSGNDRTGPIILTYLEDAALSRAGVLTLKGEELTRKKAPLIESYSIPYTAEVLFLLDSFFPNENQVTFNDFNEKTFWFDICLWNDSDIEYIFTLMERKGFISVDRQMQPWIIERKIPSNEVWPFIFDEIS